MTETKNEDRVDGVAMLRMATRLAEAMPDEFRKLLGILTYEGDIGVIRQLYSAGLLMDAGAQAQVLPLPMRAPDPAEALELVRAIFSIDGKPDVAAALYQFSSVRDEDSVRVLAMLGFDPNQWINPDLPVAITPLSAQLSRSPKVAGQQTDRLPAILAILEVLRERDEVPMKDMTDRGTLIAKQWDLFQAATNTAVNSFSESVYSPIMENLVQWPLPDSWRSAAGRAIVEFFPSGNMPNQVVQSRLLANIMAMAKFHDAAPWAEILTRVNARGDTSDMGAWLCDNIQCGEKGIAVVQNMLAHGVDINGITFNLYSENRMSYGTLLHSAIMRKHGPMTELLLEAGAQVDAVVLPHPGKPRCAHPDIGLSAIGLAEKHYPGVLPMLHAKKAKDAIARVLDQTASAANMSNSRGM